jgi:co-chaperonin GroES (HSP10)
MSRQFVETKRRVRKISPLGMRVLVQVRKESNQTDAGLYLPEGARENTNESLLGEVIEVASAVDEDTSEETNISGIPFGALVLFPRKAGTRVPWDDNLRVLETKEILALVHEVEVS